MYGHSLRYCAACLALLASALFPPTAGAAPPDADELTRSAVQAYRGAALGTPAYMSPEQVQGLPLVPESDVYAMGIVLFEPTPPMVASDAPNPDSAPSEAVQPAARTVERTPAPPRVAVFARREAGEIPRPRTVAAGTRPVRVSTTPPGAQLYELGERCGPAPQTLYVPHGATWTAEARKSGFGTKRAALPPDAAAVTLKRVAQPGAAKPDPKAIDLRKFDDDERALKSLEGN